MFLLRIATPALSALKAWPLPALGGWLLAWAAFVGLRAVEVPLDWALTVGILAPLPLAWLQQPARRVLIVGAGFPLAALVSGQAATVPAFMWLFVALPLLALYPLRAWRDAPFFPTSRGELDGLSELVTPAPKRILDAGCGLGHGLAALRHIWPSAALEGIEWSRPLALACRWRSRWACIHRGDMWTASWAPYDVVYLFQRPESMARAWAKASAEMRPGTWLVSLEFEVPGLVATARLSSPGRRSVWAYRLGCEASVSHANQSSMTDSPGR